MAATVPAHVENLITSPKSPTDADRAVGQRITAFRKAARLSQTALGEAIGVTFQQVQKYEKGQNRVGAGRLVAVAETLGVSVTALLAQAEREPITIAFLMRHDEMPMRDASRRLFDLERAGRLVRFGGDRRDPLRWRPATEAAHG